MKLVTGISRLPTPRILTTIGPINPSKLAVGLRPFSAHEPIGVQPSQPRDRKLTKGAAFAVGAGIVAIAGTVYKDHQKQKIRVAEEVFMAPSHSFYEPGEAVQHLEARRKAMQQLDHLPEAQRGFLFTKLLHQGLEQRGRVDDLLLASEGLESLPYGKSIFMEALQKNVASIQDSDTRYHLGNLILKWLKTRSSDDAALLCLYLQLKTQPGLLSTLKRDDDVVQHAISLEQAKTSDDLAKIIADGPLIFRLDELQQKAACRLGKLADQKAYELIEKMLTSDVERFGQAANLAIWSMEDPALILERHLEKFSIETQVNILKNRPTPNSTALLIELHKRRIKKDNQLLKQTLGDFLRVKKLDPLLKLDILAEVPELTETSNLQFNFNQDLNYNRLNQQREIINAKVEKLPVPLRIEFWSSYALNSTGKKNGCDALMDLAKRFPEQRGNISTKLGELQAFEHLSAAAIQFDSIVAVRALWEQRELLEAVAKKTRNSLVRLEAQRLLDLIVRG
jgi:hypothetical protein